MIRLSPVLDGLGTYPFVRLEEAARARLRAAGIEIIDFGMGEPREETPAFIRRGAGGRDHAARAVPERRRAAGAARGDRGVGGAPLRRGAGPGHARSSRRWAPRRPSSGSRTCSAATRSSIPQPAYPVYDRGARFAGKEIVELPLREENGWLPDLGARRLGRASSILWLNYPNNPTGATAPLEFYEEAAALARRHGFVLASDEAYSELYFGDSAAESALQVARPARTCRVQHAVQALVDARLSLGLRRRRPGDRRRAEEVPAERRRRAAGVLPARGDRGLERRGARRPRCAPATAPSATLLLPALESMGLRSAGGDATFFLWMEGSDALAAEWLERGRHRRARLVLRSGGRGLPAARARPAAGGDRARVELISRLRAVPRSSPASCLSAAAPRRCRSSSCGGTAARSRRSARGP